MAAKDGNQGPVGKTGTEDGEEKTRWTAGRGSAVATIHLTPHGKEDYYTISYWLDGKRRRQMFKTLTEAKAEASVIGTDLTKGDLGSAELTRNERAPFHRA